MDKKLNNKNSMYLSAYEVMETHKTVWELIPIFVALMATFKALLDKISTTAREAGVVLTGVTEGKNEVMTSLRSMVFSMASMLALYAKKQANLELRAKVFVSETKINKMPQNKLLLFANEIVGWLEQYKTDLIATYGLTEAKITRLKDLIKSATAAVPQPDARYSEKKAANKQLDALFVQTDMFLEEEFDSAVNSIREDNGELHNAYFNARVIKDRGIRHEPKPEEGTETPKTNKA
jgi:hypothetical protein